MRPPHPNPLRREGLLGRVAPFAGVTLLVLALTAATPGDIEEPWAFAVACVLTIVIVTSPWWVPWGRLPFWTQAIPPIAYFAVVALLRETQGGADSVHNPLVALPILWLALYGTRRELEAAIVGTSLVFVVPYVLVAGDSYPDSELARGLVWTGVSMLLGFTIQHLVQGARRQAGRAQAQARVLERSEAHLRRILETAHDAFVSMDERGRITEWNPQAERTFGWAREEVLGRVLAETLIPPRHREAHRRGIQRFLETGEGPVLDQRLELDALLRDGSTIPVELTISAVATQERLLFHAFIRDISERKRSERYFEAQHAVTRVLAESSTSAEAIRGVVQALGEEIGWEVGVFWAIDEAPGVLRPECFWQRPGADLSSFEEISRAVTFTRGVGLPGEVWQHGRPRRIDDVARYEGFMRAEAARERGLHGAIALPVKSSGRVTGVIEFFSRTAEGVDDDLVDLVGRLGSQIGDFLERKHAEEESERIKDEFFTLVSHEFRTPLTSIIGYLELLLEDEGEALPAEDRRRFLDVVKRNSQRLMRLVEDLLFVNKVQSGEFSLRRQRVDFDALAAACVEAARPIADEAGVRLQLDSRGETIVWGDPDRLAQLLDNLVSNAVKYTPAGERVNVGLGGRDHHLVLEVHNTGAFIPPHERERLFERFFRASTASSSKAPGIGLGLTITQAIVSAHGGRIAVESSEEQGTTFRVDLPLGADEETASAAGMSAAQR